MIKNAGWSLLLREVGADRQEVSLRSWKMRWYLLEARGGEGLPSREEALAAALRCEPARLVRGRASRRREGVGCGAGCQEEESWVVEDFAGCQWRVLGRFEF